MTATVTITFHTNIWEGVTASPWTVHVTTPITFTAMMTIRISTDEVAELAAHIEAMGLDWGTENSLCSKLNNAIKSLEKGQIQAAIGQLEAFTHQVEALRTTKLTEEQANYLVTQAQAIINLLRT
jgi:predicted SPOUT superfamily RNA methylase MTH1